MLIYKGGFNNSTMMVKSKRSPESKQVSLNSNREICPKSPLWSSFELKFLYVYGLCNIKQTNQSKKKKSSYMSFNQILQLITYIIHIQNVKKEIKYSITLNVA